MPEIPRDTSLDSTLALLHDPYAFIATRSRRFRSDVFETRLLLRPTICVTGPRAAELFYDEERFLRHGATPGRIQDTLFGRGGVQGLDGAAHRHRKQLFLSLMTPEGVVQLGELADDWWRAYARRWVARDRVVLYQEVREILTRAVCGWAGVPLAEPEVRRRTRQLTGLFEGAGAVGPKHWWARLARRRAERWMAGIIGQVRAGQLTPPEQSAARAIAGYRDPDGDLLSPRVAAVELLNVVRPTVAVAVFIVFVAHALHRYPEWRERIAAGEDGSAELFVQEVRRFYPFFPSVIARARRDFAWQGYHFPQGRRVVLDLYGTDHDARTWDAPEEFRPERFRQWDGSPFNFIPQGGGDHALNHRCPGEWSTIELMKRAASFLAGQMSYAVPEQDSRIDLSRLPALPRGQFVITDVRVRG